MRGVVQWDEDGWWMDGWRMVDDRGPGGGGGVGEMNVVEPHARAGDGKEREVWGGVVESNFVKNYRIHTE